MKKNIYFMLFLSLFSFFLNVNANSELKESSLTGVFYDGYLSDKTELRLTGTNLEKCDTLIFDGRNIKQIDTISTKITFKFSEIASFNGELLINCEGDILKKKFNFPYIENVLYDESNSDRDVEIKGFNFTDGVLSVEEGVFKSRLESSTIFKGELGESSDTANFYVTNGGNKSNLYVADIKLPKINFINSENGFSEGNRIDIYGVNLDGYKNSKILLGDKEIPNYGVLEGGKGLSFESYGINGNLDLIVESNGFKSDPLKVYVNGKRPEIKGVAEKYDIEKGEQLHIEGINFNKSSDNLKVFINGTNQAYTELTNGYIRLDNYNLLPGENFIYIHAGGLNSNVHLFNNNEPVPEITGIYVENAEEGKRSIKVYILGHQDDDKILFNGSQIIPESCISGVCRVEINENILKGEFKIVRGNYTSLITEEFDISDKFTPYIEYVDVEGDTLASGTKIEVIGNNFYNSTVTSGNLFRIGDNNKPEVSVGNRTISGKINHDYVKTGISSITVNNKGISKSFSFDLNKAVLNGGKLYNSAFIEEIKITKNGLYKSGDQITLQGKGFKYGDIVYIGSISTLFDVDSKSFIVPVGLNEGYYDLYIKDRYDSISNRVKIYISAQNSGHDYFLNYNKISDSIFELNSDSFNSTSLYSFDFQNNIDNMIINSIKFKTKGSDYLDLFTLKYNGGKVIDAKVDKNGYITFDKKIEFNKGTALGKFELFKGSSYNELSNYEIKLDSIDAEYENLKNENINFTYPSNTNYITIIIDDADKCVDSLSTRLNCNSFNQGKIYTEEKKETNTVYTGKVTNTINDADDLEVIDYSLLINKSENIIYQNLITSKNDLTKTVKGRKYYSQINSIVTQLPNEKLYKLLKKVYIVNDQLKNNNSAKYVEVKRVLKYLEAKIESKLIKE